jgi:hypothetical protein
MLYFKAALPQLFSDPRGPSATPGWPLQITEEVNGPHSSETIALLRKVARSFDRIDRNNDLPVEDRQALKAFYVEHFAPPEARKLIRKYFPEELESLNRRKVWIDPHGAALAFLREKKTQPGS